MEVRSVEAVISALNSAEVRCVSYNGEIYNYPALRAQLLERGRRFVSNCDTETLLHLYAEKGPAMVNDLRGMYAFTIWDARQRTLFCTLIDLYAQTPLPSASAFHGQLRDNT